jgi:hypothetical protein
MPDYLIAAVLGRGIFKAEYLGARRNEDACLRAPGRDIDGRNRPPPLGLWSIF